MSKEKTVYCGSGKKQSDKWIKASINVDKFKDHIQEYKGHKFIKININIKDEADKFDKDVSISIDTWQPEEKKQSNDTSNDDDLPF
jgi:hypothetical protein